MILILYDITNDRIRDKVANCCLDYGLKRIQYSAFYGKLSRNLYEELLLKLKRLLGRATGVIQSFRLCQTCQLQATKFGTNLVNSIPEQGVLTYEAD